VVAITVIPRSRQFTPPLQLRTDWPRGRWPVLPYPKRSTVEEPIPLPKFCADCGAKTMSRCHGCGAYIQFKDSRVHYVPNYCTECGEPFPWVSSALQELGRVTDEAQELTDQEKNALKRAYPELTKNTAKTRGAIETLKVYCTKFSPAAMAIVRTVLINVMTDEGKQGLSSLFNHLK
jgi:hypothetical protein